MPALPLPLLTFVLCAVACALVWRIDPGSALARRFFTAVFALLAAIMLMIGLRFGYGIEGLVPVQRALPLFVGPAIWLGFLALTRPPDAMGRPALLHLGAAALLALLPQVLPPARALFDLMLASSYLVYAALVVRLWRGGADALPLAPLGMVPGLRTWMPCAAAMLAIMALFDLAIAASFALARPDDAVRLVALGSVLSLLTLIVAVTVLPRGPITGPVRRPAREEGEDARLERAARDLLTGESLYLDTGLTLDRLARRLHVPARALSEAINRTKGMNVSQYVNGFRLDHAAGLLRDTDLSVTKVAERSGFLARSNFYREFDRVHGCTPARFRARAR